MGSQSQPDKAIPIALIIVGALVVLQSVLDFIWTRLPGSATSSPASDSSATILGTYVAAIATVLGLIAVFNTDPTFAIRFGALVLVIGLIIGLMVIGYTVYGVGGKGTASLIAWMVSLLFATTSLGLASIGLSVYYFKS
jgi:uncharacterized membrane protein